MDILNSESNIGKYYKSIISNNSTDEVLQRRVELLNRLLESQSKENCAKFALELFIESFNNNEYRIKYDDIVYKPPEARWTFLGNKFIKCAENVYPFSDLFNEKNRKYAQLVVNELFYIMRDSGCIEKMHADKLI